MISLSESGENL